LQVVCIAIDAQLDEAVKVLQTDVVAWKRSHPGTATKLEDKSTTTVLPSSSGK
jgi:hypothetical protein